MTHPTQADRPSTRGAPSGLFWASLSALVGVAILVSLGAWQWQRLAWKEGLIARIEARTTADPVPLAEFWRSRFDPEKMSQQATATVDWTYTRVTFCAHFIDAAEKYLYMTRKGRPGWHVYTPAIVLDETDELGTKRAADNEGGPIVVQVNRGFIPVDARTARISDINARLGADTGTNGTPADPCPWRLTGLVRPAMEPGLFEAENAPSRNEWVWRDLAAMAEADRPLIERVTGMQAATPHPGFSIDLEASAPAVAEPIPGTTITRPANRHFEYAMTWWGLALTLVGVYAGLLWSRRNG